MQNLFFLLLAIGFSFTSCNKKKMEDESMGACKSATKQEVIEMAKHYKDIITKDPSKSILQVSMDSEMFGNMIKNSKEFKMIATADLKTDEINMYLQVRKMDDSYTYCDINSYATVARKPRPFCPPPPGCDTMNLEIPVKKF